MKKNGKPFVNENNNEETGGLYFNKKLRLVSISGVITWSLADEFFNVLTGFELLSQKNL